MADKHFDHVTITLEQAIEVCRQAAQEWWGREDMSPTGTAVALIARLVERYGDTHD